MIFCEDNNSLEIFNKIQKNNKDKNIEIPPYFYMLDTFKNECKTSSDTID